MSIPTVQVTCVAYDQNGSPVSGGTFRFKLDRTEIYNGFVVPEVVEGTANAQGVCVVNLWPNALGTNGSQYRVQAYNPDTGAKYLDAFAVIPNSNCYLQDVIQIPPFPPIDQSQQALIAAQAAASQAAAEADVAAAEADAAALSAAAAAASATAAANSATAAANSATSASTSASTASTAATTAQTAATTATTKASEATTSASNAAASASSAATSATTATNQAISATNSATAAANSATSAAGSATTATTKASEAASSAAAASSSATSASTSAATATTKASEAQTSATQAATSASNAASSATQAASSATAAAGSATTASSAATTATDAATTATGAASTATTQANAAATSATNAAASATAAGTSATNASGSADAAEAAQIAAEQARDQTLAAFDNFDDRYLGPKATDPTTDNDGNPLVSGALYYNTNPIASGGGMKVYDGTAWLAAYASLSGALLSANNLNDLASAPAARVNLGLGNVENKSAATILGELTSSNVVTALGFTPYSDANPAGYVSQAGARAAISVAGSLAYDPVTGVITYNQPTNISAFTNDAGYLTGITGLQVSTALGFTPYDATNPNAYINQAGARSAISASGSLSYNSATGVISYTQPTNVSTFTNDAGYLTGITGTQVITALGYTPYDASNPSGYITSAALSPYLLSATAASTYLTSASAASTYLTSATAASTYLPLAGGTLTGSLAFSGTGLRITGDFSNATLANRLALQTSTANGNTGVFLLPNGTAQIATLRAYNVADPTNGSFVQLQINASAASINSDASGSGSALPLALSFANVERARVDGSGLTTATDVSGKLTLGRFSNALTDSYFALGTGSTGYTFQNVGGTANLMQLNSSGNLGLGVTPSAWGNGGNIQLNGANIFGNGALTYGANAYYNAGWKYITSGVGASYVNQYGGAHQFFTAPSGTAGNAISFTQAMTLTATGNLLVGTTSDNGNRLQIQSPAAASDVMSVNSLNGLNTLVLGVNEAGGGSYINEVRNAALRFATNNTERARISAAGGFSVGTTADPGAGAIYATGNITAYYSDDRLKTRLGGIENALDKVEQLSGFYYEANETAQALGYKAKREVGVSAQQVQAVLPEVVSPAPIDQQYLTVDYERIVPLLIEAIKELNAKVARLESGTH